MTKTYTRLFLGREWLDIVYSRASNLPEYGFSHRKLQANYVGCIGEKVMTEFFQKHNIAFADDRHLTSHDFSIGGKITLDVKTKDRTVLPKIHYDNSVPLYNHEHQRPNYYYFVSLLRDRNSAESDIYRFKEAFILGGIDIQRLDKIGKKWGAGETDPTNGTKFWTACINVGMDDLIPNNEMISVLKSGRRLSRPLS